MQHGILIVDDEADIVDSLERQFRKQYRVFKATSGIDALKILQKENVSIIISDQRMPEMTGVQLLERAQMLRPESIRMLLTGYTDVESVIAAINKGQIYRYITKPWDPTDLDITVQKAIETFELRSELNEKNRRLETMLEELKSLDAAKTQFMLLIGHELKTPLTTVRSFVELLKEEKLSADIQKYVNRIYQGTDRLQDIVFDILDLLGATTGKIQLKKASGRLLPVAERLTAELKAAADKKSITFRIKDDKAVAFFDDGLLTKALRKLIHNAVKFSPDGQNVDVTIANHTKKPSITISNKGPRIPEGKIQAIFKPFEMDEDIMHHSTGIGLGLSVAAALLKHAGADIEFQSDDKATTITITLESAP